MFASAIQSGMVWLAFVGALNTIVALYYYLSVLKVIYLYRSEDEAKPLVISWYWKVALGICTSGILILGIWIAPWYGWSQNAINAIGFLSR